MRLHPSLFGLAASALCACQAGTSAPAPERAARPVIFVGLDGADWQLLDEYMAAGTMPNLSRLAREGRSGVLRAFDPPLSPLLWTTMTTGTSPLVHRVLDFTRFNPETGAREPIGGGERAVPAVWNMASDNGRRAAVFGLWATWPAEPIDGLMVADRFVSRPGGRRPPPGAVYPPEREAWAERLRAAAEKTVDLEALRAYLPWLTEDDYRRAAAAPEPLADPVSGLRQILAETRTVHALASAWITEEHPDLAVVYFEGTDLVGHLFAPYAPPRQPTVSAADFARFSAVPERYFREVDGLLGEILALAADRGVVLLASDHGFFWREGRPAELASREAATAGQWHRHEGVYALWGHGIAPAAERGEGAVAQVCATLLALLGLPPGQGLAGPPLAGVAPAAGAAVDYRASYRPPAAPRAAAGGEELTRLRALGYLGTGEPSAASRAGATRTPASFNNEGLLLAAAGRTPAAAAAFEQALALDPDYPSALWNLSQLLFNGGGDAARSDRLLAAAVAHGLPQGPERVLGRAVARQRQGDAAAGLALVGAVLAARPGEPELHLFRGRYRLERHDCRGALADFTAAAAGTPDDPLAHASLGLARACLGDLAGARQAFDRSLALDPDQPEIRKFLADLPTLPPGSP